MKQETTRERIEILVDLGTNLRAALTSLFTKSSRTLQATPPRY